MDVPTHINVCRQRYLSGLLTTEEFECEVERLLAEALADVAVPIRMGGLPPAAHHDPTGEGLERWEQEQQLVYAWP